MTVRNKGKISFKLKGKDIDELFDLEEKLQKYIKFDTEYDVLKKERIWYFD